MMKPINNPSARSLTRVVVFAAILANATSQLIANCVPAPPGLVAWWPAEGNANDVTGHNNGTLEGNAGFGTGEVGQAFSFDGYSGAVYVGDAPDLRFTNAMTIEAWVYPNAYGPNHACEIVSKYFGGNGASYTTSIDTSGLAYLIVSSDGSTTTLNVDYTVLYTVHPVPLNQWSHFAATYDGSKVRIYLNGVLENQANWNQGIFAGTAPLFIGATAIESVFNGLIDEVAVYNQALSGAAIQAIYNAGSSGKCGVPPLMVTQPQSQTVLVGSSASFSASAVGTAPLNYQWSFNGTNIASATNTTLVLTNVQLNQAGSYSLQVMNAYGTTNSDDAVLTVNPPPPCVSCPSGVIAWWPGAGDALDQAGTNNGTLRGAVTFVPGQVGQCFSFDGISASVLVPDAPALRFTNAMTIEAWIYPKALGGTPREIVSKYFGGSGNQLSYTTSIDTSGRPYVILSNDGRTTAANVDYVQLISPDTVPTGQWTHFAATYDGASLKLYLNGALEAQTAWTGGIFPGNAPLVIGEAYYQSLFNGMIDEPTVYNRALSADEIQSIYGALVSGKCGLPPAIFVSPTSQAVRPGTNVTFSVTASGHRPLGYQWMLDAGSLSGTTNSSLTLTNVQSSNAGSYSVVVTNAMGSVTSSPAVLKVSFVFAFGNGVPLANPQNSFVGPVTVQLQTAYTNGLIFYTLDGSEPTFDSSAYTRPFTVSQSVVLRALAYSADFLESSELDPTTILIVPLYSLTTASSGGGSIVLNPSGGSYVSNSVVSLTAAPAAGWTFLQWLGDLTGANPVANVTMNGNRHITAVFGTQLSTTVAGNGSVALSPPAGLYPYGTVVALTATPQAGSSFALWGNAGSGSTNPLYFAVTNANPTVSCLFAALAGGQASLVVSPSGHGTVDVSPRANAYSIGMGVTLTAVPDPGQAFLGWAGDASGTNNPLSLTLDRSKSITADFTRNPRLTADTDTANLAAEGFQMLLDGEFGAVYQINASTGLVDWLPLMTVTNPFGRVQVADPGATNAPRKFYRALQMP